MLDQLRANQAAQPQGLLTGDQKMNTAERASTLNRAFHLVHHLMIGCRRTQTMARFCLVPRPRG